VFLTVVMLAVTVFDQLERRVDVEQASRLKETLRRAAISCYAVEGRYPPDLQYLQDHYGVVVDQSKFYVDYFFINRNTMPIIDVIWPEGAVG